MVRPQFQIVLFLAAVLLLGALLAPPLFWGGKWLAGMIVSFKQMDAPVLGWIGKKLTAHQFDSYYNRAFLVSALGLLWPFLKWMRLSKGSLGLERNPARATDALTGFLMAAGFLALLICILLATGTYVRAEDVNWAGIIPRAILTAIVVALLEEWLFRGVFLGVALRAARPWAAILLVSALFAVLHLMRAPDIFITEPHGREAALKVLRSPQWFYHADLLRSNSRAMDWMIDPAWRQFAPSRIHPGSGLEMTGVIFKRMTSPAPFLSQFLTLFAIGVILARARCATRSLWLPIGLHAGWIFANTLGLGLTKPSPAVLAGQCSLEIAGVRVPWVGEEVKIGLAPLLTLIVTALAVEWWMRRRGGGLQPASSSAKQASPPSRHE